MYSKRHCGERGRGWLVAVETAAPQNKVGFIVEQTRELLSPSGISSSRQVPGLVPAPPVRVRKFWQQKPKVHLLGAATVGNVLQGRGRPRAGWEVASDQRFGGKPPSWKPCRDGSDSATLVDQAGASVRVQTAGAPVRLPLGSGEVGLEFQSAGGGTRKRSRVLGGF